MSTVPPSPLPSAPPAPAAIPVHDAYVKRLRARLAKPAITVTEARDGILDCFVSTYFEGVSRGLTQLVGVKAEPDEVARVAGQMFRVRLGKHGVSFEAPTLDALSKVKDEVDQEFHFAELPAEHRALHDQVCTLLVAKADGSLAHRGDRSVVTKSAEPARATEPAARVPEPVRPPEPVMPPTSEVAAQLRGVLASTLQGLARDASKESVRELERRLEQLGSLVTAIAAYETR
ncbi:MAG: hypothetical protein Q8S33_01655 [Myxococcales bacterium]|nr:hypothetical protein [Myxococcales bacterium]MDP3499000.1 hypothetical protein [Myxococcales bacterium]